MGPRLRPFPLSCQASRPHDLTEGNKGSEDQILPLAMWEGLVSQPKSAARCAFCFSLHKTSTGIALKCDAPPSIPTTADGGLACLPCRRRSTSNGLALSFFNPMRIVVTDPLTDMTRSVVPFLWGDPNRCGYVLRARMEIISRK
jgi:hypothetical protein